MALNLLKEILVPIDAGDNLQSDLESYIQENGEPSKKFKEEVRKYLQENNNPGVQMAIREEQVENKGDIGNYKLNKYIKFYNSNY